VDCGFQALNERIRDLARFEKKDRHLPACRLAMSNIHAFGQATFNQDRAPFGGVKLGLAHST
jgi:hypothetical protein